MKTITFELEIPIRQPSPQWLRNRQPSPQWLLFLHAVNTRAAAEPGDNPVPFSSPSLECVDNGVGIEVYDEAIIFHTDSKDYMDPDPPHKYTAYIRFEATSVRLRRLFAESVPEFDEAQPGVGITFQDASQRYAYQRLKVEAFEIQIEAEDNEARIAALTRQLELAENVGD